MRGSHPEFRRIFGPGLVTEALQGGETELMDDTIDDMYINDLAAQYEKDLSVPSALLSRGAENRSYAADGLLDVFRWGLRQPSSHRDRQVSTCAQCREKLFRPETHLRPPDDPEIVRICPACNEWVHGECYLQHMADHVPGLLCRGVH